MVSCDSEKPAIVLSTLRCTILNEIHTDRKFIWLFIFLVAFFCVVLLMPQFMMAVLFDLVVIPVALFIIVGMMLICVDAFSILNFLE